MIVAASRVILTPYKLYENQISKLAFTHDNIFIHFITRKKYEENCSLVKTLKTCFVKKARST